ncbi:UNVERIFIED_CONTAM: toxoplasma gondii family A protein [Hammondia hammondi]|eukprot:XP_008887106.1 toxoplasma gondii family A protein [Hammondia hammondi]
MAQQRFRAVCLTLMVGTILSCAASKTNESSPENDFDITIPHAGLEGNVERVVSLGPSGTFRVVDETAKAVYLPETAVDTENPTTKPYGLAYRYENGVCDFRTTIRFKDVFPGYDVPLWVREDASSEEAQKDSPGGPVKYVFTNPPAVHLGEGVSFCVRFKTVLVSGSQTTTSTAATSGASTQEQTQASPEPEPEDDDTEEQGQKSEFSAPDPKGDSHISGEDSRAQENEGGEPEEEEEEERMDAEDGHSSPMPPAIPPSSGPPTTPSKDPESLEENQSTQGGSATVPEDEQVTAASQNSGHLVDGDAAEHTTARLRRLSETPAENEAYLTIVVHSAAWGFADGMSVLSLFLISVAGTLAPVS